MKPDHSAEIAYVLGRAYWRKGYATAACKAMIEELRSSYGVGRLTATLDPANVASVALIEKLGGTVVECAFVIDLISLGGRDRLEAEGHKMFALCEFEGE